MDLSVDQVKRLMIIARAFGQLSIVVRHKGHDPVVDRYIQEQKIIIDFSIKDMKKKSYPDPIIDKLKEWFGEVFS